jgi:hypothetical protein
MTNQNSVVGKECNKDYPLSEIQYKESPIAGARQNQRFTYFQNVVLLKE